MSDIRLCMETSAEICSVALFQGTQLLELKESKRERSHGSMITLFIQELLDAQQLKIEDLDHVIVSSGPGSYTGLRVGYSTAKGLCYPLDIPLISVSTLAALGDGLIQKHNDPNVLYCPIIDARRMEVYTSLYSPSGEELRSPEALIMDQEFIDTMRKYGKTIIFGGSGAEKLQDTNMLPEAEYDLEIYPSAIYLINQAEHMIKNDKFENLAYSEPYYIKSVYIHTK